MVLDEALIQYLVCPSTRMKLTMAEGKTARSINAKIESDELSTVDGTLFREQVDGFLVTADGQRAYPIINGIPHLLVSSALDLS